MRHGFALILLATLASTASAQTQFYKCKDKWGQPIFSQRPCGDDAETSSVSGPQHTGGTTAAAPGVPTAPADGPSTWDKIEASNTLREARREIDRREDRIESLEAERDRKIAALKNKKRYANNNLAGATWEESISSEMQAINHQYQSKIDSERRKIDRLQEKADRVAESL
ncbi:DUF4124 domain-containing protein [Parahaliea mediterranea]|uniref:DUF4124 domain-containing protein n=1 Tax=Parahaliea mediterranea TaxID=651086 RepID=A0A939DIR8_9GAMM|nr:DUF4124 domain-containing protein [Parahaliea mediterranea]MBN7798748.1 DUF4124 domain-containing protein [Parahaliea mediterranea]